MAVDITPELIRAARFGDANTVKRLLQGRQDPDYRGAALVAASRAGSLAVVQLLLRGGAKANYISGYDTTALMEAAESRDAGDIVTELLAAGAEADTADSRGYTALMYAAERDAPTVVQTLLATGANVNTQDSNGRGWTALILACREARFEYVHSKHALSSYERKPDVVKALIAKGAKVNITDIYGRTALHYAAANGFAEVVSVLLASGAALNVIDKPSDFDEQGSVVAMCGGSTPLHKAAANGYDEVVEILLANNAEVNVKDQSGRTPLHEAAKGYYLKNKPSKPAANVRFSRKWALDRYRGAIEFLLASGADVNAKDNEGLTPFDIAKQQGHDELVDLLASPQSAQPGDASVTGKDKSSEVPIQPSSGIKPYRIRLLRTWYEHFSALV